MVKIKLLMSHFVANKQNGLTLMPSEGTDLFISKLNMKTVLGKYYEFGVGRLSGLIGGLGLMRDNSFSSTHRPFSCI